MIKSSIRLLYVHFLEPKLMGRYSHTIKATPSAEPYVICTLTSLIHTWEKLIGQGKRETRYIHPRSHSRPRTQFGGRC
jgi:hypothetical protein